VHFSRFFLKINFYLPFINPLGNEKKRYGCQQIKCLKTAIFHNRSVLILISSKNKKAATNSVAAEKLV